MTIDGILQRCDCCLNVKLVSDFSLHKTFIGHGFVLEFLGGTLLRLKHVHPPQEVCFQPSQHYILYGTI